MSKSPTRKGASAFAPSTAQGAFEARVDDLEKRLQEKCAVNSGFADAEVKSRQLEKSFKYFDTDNSGFIDYTEFFAAMTKLNFVGCQKEIEALFNRYDEDASGTIDYKEFSYGLFGIGEKPRFDSNAKNIVDRVKARILERGGVSGIHGCARVLRRMDTDGSNNLTLSELLRGLEDYGIRDISPEEQKILFSYFDRDGSGTISIEEFLRGLKTGMSYERKLLVRQAFNLLDKDGSNVITVQEILDCYDTSTHPDVHGGKKTPEDAAMEMLANFEQGGDVDGNVTWPEFLDYYKGLSVGIDNDEYFELMMRNAWHMSGGEGAAAGTACRRVLVIHSDNSQEVVEVQNDLGMKFDIENVTKALLNQGVRDIIDIKFSA